MPQQFALVSYITGPLGTFLGRLSSGLVPGCGVRPHITLLPPRLVRHPARALSEALDASVSRIRAFEVTLGDVEIFPITDVIYLSVRGGWPEAVHAHGVLSAGRLRSREAFPFHPHVTLAQNIPAGEAARTAVRARLAWRQWQESRSFAVATFALVRDDGHGRWETFSEHTLSPLALPRTA